MIPIRKLATLWLSACLIGLSAAAQAAPKAELWERWEAHSPGANQAIDHAAWDAWLKRFVVATDDGINRVAYAAARAVATAGSRSAPPSLPLTGDLEQSVFTLSKETVQ